MTINGPSKCYTYERGGLFPQHTSGLNLGSMEPISNVARRTIFADEAPRDPEMGV